MATPIRVGLLGLGQRGLQHLRTLWRLQNEGLVRVSALIDVFDENLDVSKIRRYVPTFDPVGIDATTRFDTALARRDFEALYVAIPPGVHDGEVVAAAEAGCHLFVEKPMSLFLDEALEMNAAIRKSGVVATVGFQQRYAPRNEAVRTFLADKRPVMVTFVNNAPLEAHSVKHTATERLGGPTDRVWTASFEWSGSTVVEAGIHQVDLMRYWCGEIESVEASYVHRREDEIVDGKDNPHAYRVTYRFRNGAIGNLLLSRIRRVGFGDSYASVLWTGGHLRFEGADAVAYYDERDEDADRPPRPEEVRHVLPKTSRLDPTEAIHRVFLDAVRTGRLDRVRSPFPDALYSLAAVLGANVSDRLDGARVDLDELLSGTRYADFRRKVPTPPMS